MPLSPSNSVSSSVKRGPAQAKPKKTRSRNGCPQCKAKRLKCDETRPSCLMCTKSGRKCPGYSTEFRWSTKHEKTLDAPKATETVSLEDLLTAASKVISGDAIPEPLPPQQQQHPVSARPPTSSPIPLHHQGLPSQPPPPLASTATQHLPLCSDLDPRSPGKDASTLGLSTPSPETFPADDLLPDFCWDQPLSVDALGNVDLTSDGSISMVPKNAFQIHQRSPSSRERSNQPIVPWIHRSIMDRSSLLVEEWFKNVCTIWSCYDSEVNLNRKLAADTWTQSESVMNCMQSMAATCLSSQMPQMRPVAIASLKKAVSSVKRELRSVAAQPSARARFPTDLLMSLCCVGTAACWIDTKQLAAQFLREARALIDRLNREPGPLSPQEQQVLVFYNNSIIYWDMLVAVVSDEEDKGLLCPQYPQNVAGQIVPHPWTGISAAAQRLFARAIRLCRRFRRHLRKDSISTITALRTALRDIKEAQDIEEELLALEHGGVNEICETGDRLTPTAHLLDVAEGYRLASLLQLYQTFPDLVVRRLPEDAIEGDVVPWDRWIVPLSLRLVNTLKKVPPDSGTRCIQPLLYISASSGLKFDFDTMMAAAATIAPQYNQSQASIPSDNSSRDFGNSVGPQSTGTGSSSSTSDLFSSNNMGNNSSSSTGGGGSGMDHDLELSLSLDPATDSDGVEDGLDVVHVPLTKLSIEVSHARRFVMERLSALEHSLPPAPVRVAKELVVAIWAAYDGEKPGTNHIHWIDVMEDSNLKTIFG